MHITRHLTRRLLVTAAAASFLLGATACGDDDDAATTDAPAASTSTTAATATTADGAAADVTAFCDAELAAEAAASQDPTTAGPQFEALVAAAPAEITDSVTAVIEHAADGPGTPAFDEPYAEMIGFVQANCGFADLTIRASEYKFEGVPEEVPAGSTVITLQNNGEEFHELLLVRVNDGVTESAEELLALPEEEADAKVTMAAAAFSAPGATAYTATALEPGRYIAVCFLPQGATPDVMAQMQDSGPEGTLPPTAGPPHFMAGMVREFTVA